MPLYDALMDSVAIRHILTRHEQGAGHAAEGYAAASGRVGVAIATSGPGATNLVTPIADAHTGSVPILIITGQVSSELIGTDAFQEADIIGITTPIIKHSLLVTTAEEIPSALANAHRIASTGRPGPVLVDITKDAQQGSAVFRWPTKVGLPGYNPRTWGEISQINAAVQLIAQSERPVLYIGGGVTQANASIELADLVEATGIPIVTTLAARGVFPDSDERHLGLPGEHGAALAGIALQECDLVIAIGARFHERMTCNPTMFAPKAKVIHADIDPTEISKIHIADISIVGDAKNVIRSLTDAFVSTDAWTTSDFGPWWKELTELRRKLPVKYETPDDDLLSPQQVIERIGALTGQDAVYVVGAGQHQISGAQLASCNRPKSWLTSGGPGYGVPAAMGAKVAEPDRVVWTIVGDGCFQMTNQELATCTVNRIPIKVAVLNTTLVGGHRRIPDFVKLAEAYGALALRVTKPEQIETAIELALATKDRTVLIDFAVSPNLLRGPVA